MKTKTTKSKKPAKAVTKTSFDIFNNKYELDGNRLFTNGVKEVFKTADEAETAYNNGVSKTVW